MVDDVETEAGDVCGCAAGGIDGQAQVAQCPGRLLGVGGAGDGAPSSTPVWPEMWTMREPVAMVTWAAPGIGARPAGSSVSMVMGLVLLRRR